MDNELLRDEFAKMALESLLASVSINQLESVGGLEFLGRTAYSFADFMMAARKKEKI